MTEIAEHQFHLHPRAEVSCRLCRTDRRPQ
jgi:hypothetical protein